MRRLSTRSAPGGVALLSDAPARSTANAGSINERSGITVLRYAGDGLESYEEDVYNPMNVLVMVRKYIQRCHKLGPISDDAKTFAKNMNWKLT